MSILIPEDEPLFGRSLELPEQVKQLQEVQGLREQVRKLTEDVGWARAEAHGAKAEAERTYSLNCTLLAERDAAQARIRELEAAQAGLLEACHAAKKYTQGDLVEPGRTVFWKLVAAIAKAEGRS